MATIEKQKITKEQMEDMSFEIKFDKFLPYVNKEAFAYELATTCVICDDDGVCYESYQFELMRAFLAAKYFTNIDTTDWETEEGRMMIYDYMNKKGALQYMDSEYLVGDIMGIYYRMYEAIRNKHECKHSLSYKIGKTFESVLGDEDIVKTLAKSREVNESLIEMMDVFRKDKKAKANGTPNPGVLNFAKK